MDLEFQPVETFRGGFFYLLLGLYLPGGVWVDRIGLFLDCLGGF